MKRTIKLALATAICIAPSFGAIINFSGSTTTLPGGEIFTISPASFTVAFNQVVSIPMSLNATSSATQNNTVLSIPLVFDIGGGTPSTLNLSGTWLTNGSTFRFILGAPLMAAISVDPAFLGYPARVNLNSALDEVQGVVGTTAFTTLEANQRVVTPEPSTFVLIGGALCGLTMFLKARQR